MKKFIAMICLVFLALGIVTTVAAQSVATYRDAAAWDAVTSTTNWNTIGYDVLLSQTSVTAAQLGTSNGIPALAGILGSSRLLSVTNTQAAFKSFLASNPVPLPYTLWARTVTTQVGGTNVVVSDWTSITVSWTTLPLPPANLRVQQLFP
jgi:hypothetical protein